MNDLWVVKNEQGEISVYAMRATLPAKAIIVGFDVWVKGVRYTVGLVGHTNQKVMAEITGRSPGEIVMTQGTLYGESEDGKVQAVHSYHLSDGMRGGCGWFGFSNRVRRLPNEPEIRFDFGGRYWDEGLDTEFAHSSHEF